MTQINTEKESLLTLETLKLKVTYDQDTGHFVWNSCRDARYVGKRADRVSNDKYLMVTISGKRYLAHRLAFMYMTGVFPVGEIDHINRDKADNRFCNLREVSRSENSQNKEMKHLAASGLQGVKEIMNVKVGNRWRASITNNYVTKIIGAFATKEDAHAAYILEKQKIHTFDSSVANVKVATPKKVNTKQDLVGKVFERLTVVKISHVANQQTYWLAKCSCGNEISVPTNQLNRGNTKSCGCYAKDMRLEGNRLRRIREKQQGEKHA